MTFDMLGIVVEPHNHLDGHFWWSLQDSEVEDHIASGFAKTPEAAAMAALEAMKRYLESEVAE